MRMGERVGEREREGGRDGLEEGGICCMKLGDRCPGSVKCAQLEQFEHSHNNKSL